MFIKICTGLILYLLMPGISCWSQNVNGKILTRIAADSNIILPPSWAFGVLYGGYTNQQETIGRIKDIKKHGYPIDAYWIDSWFWSYAEKGKGPKKYIDFVADTIAFPNRTQLWEYFKDNNIKGGFWTWDCILEAGNEKAFNAFKSRGYFSSIYPETNTWHNNGISTAMFQQKATERNSTLCGNINFDDPGAVAYFKAQMKHFFDEGADFVKLDRTADLSACKTMFEMSQEFGKETLGRGFLLSHSFGTESESYKRYPAKWTDDTRSDWTIEKPLVQFNSWVPPVAFKENIAMFTDPLKPSSKIPFLANDLGGFDMGKTSKPEEELYIRWLQFSMFNPVTEVFSQPENPTSNLAWLYSQRADTIFSKYAGLRMQLFPYIYSYALRCRTQGKGIIGIIKGEPYQYMFGEEILVAPVYEKGALKRKVFLPEGKWVNFWTDEELTGNKVSLAQSPLHQMPIFVKLGSIIPMRNYASSIQKGTNDTLILHIYPGAGGSFTLLEDDGISNQYLKGIYASSLFELKGNLHKYLLKINPVEGNYEGMETNRCWRLYFHLTAPTMKIMVDQQYVNYEYDKFKRIAKVEVPGRAVRSMIEIEVKESPESNTNN